MLCFVDESGELSNYGATGSSYFVCTAVLMFDLVPINALQNLRHQLERDGFPIPSGFHAVNDPRPRRLRVFQLLSAQQIFVHAVALRKNQVYAHLRQDQAFVYRIAFRFLLSSLLTNFMADNEEHSIIASTYSAGTTSTRLQQFQRQALAEFGAVHQGATIGFWDASSDTGLQIADG